MFNDPILMYLYRFFILSPVRHGKVKKSYNYFLWPPNMIGFKPDVMKGSNYLNEKFKLT